MVVIIRSIKSSKFHWYYNWDLKDKTNWLKNAKQKHYGPTRAQPEYLVCGQHKNLPLEIRVRGDFVV